MLLSQIRGPLLYSAGATKNHKNPPPCMVTNRVRGGEQDTLVMGDSGGYQIATGQIVITPQKREDIYNWLTTYCDIAVTLDVPTGPMYAEKENYYRSLEECLFKTLEHLAAFKEMGAENGQFLNVLQGKGIYDCDIWYDAVKHYNFYGWAIAGLRKNPLQVQLWRIIALIEDGKFDRDETWLHFLGVSDLKTAVLLTTVQEVLRQRFPKCKINVSYDTSTPFILVSKLSAFASFNLSPTRTSISTIQIDKERWADSNDPFPYSGSKIGKLVTKGDVVYTNWTGEHLVSDLGYLILNNHNVEALVSAIDAIHAVTNKGLPREHLEQILPRYLLEGRDAIESVLLEPTPKKAREKLFDRTVLSQLDNAYVNVSKFY